MVSIRTAAICSIVVSTISVPTMLVPVSLPAQPTVRSTAPRSTAARSSAPKVGPAKGTVIVVGGGSMGPEIYNAFIKAAGGPDALIVTVPNAGGADNYPQNGPSTRGWKQYGAKNVYTYFTKDRTVADADSFVAVLRKAGGIWFEGGRQFRLVDAYAGTKSEAAFNAVLARGGVVGGSSAGASILGDFLVRGAPSNNNLIMDDPGYRKGFAYLKGVGIDQHVVARERLADLADSIIPRYPKLLAISEDEGTAWVVRGDTAAIVGRNKAFVYNGRDATDAGKPFLTLYPGDTYNLATRRIMKRVATTSPVTSAFVSSMFAKYNAAAEGGATVLVAMNGNVLIDHAFGVSPQPKYMPTTTVPQFSLGDIKTVFESICAQVPEPAGRGRGGDPSADSVATAAPPAAGRGRGGSPAPPQSPLQRCVAQRLSTPIGMHKTLATETGDVHSSVDELYRLALGLENPRTYVSVPNTDPTATPATIDYARGWNADRYRGTPRFSAFGASDGKRSAFMRFPEQHVTIIVLTNDASADAKSMAEQIADKLLPVTKVNASPGAAAAWWNHVKVLSDDSLKGRDTGSPEHESATRYIAAQFRAAGLKPAGTDGWFQRIPFVEVRLDAPRVTLALREGSEWAPLALGRDVRITPRLATGDVEAPIVFVGYGLSLPSAGIDELTGLDLKGKIVLHMNGVPSGLSPMLQAHGTRSRWAAMQQAGAVGIMAIGAAAANATWNENAAAGAGTVSLADTSLDDTREQRIGATVNPALAARLFAGSGLVWDSLVAQSKRGDRLPTAALTVALRATIPTVRKDISSPNVVGIIPGTDPLLRNEVVVFTAHSDHVGTFKGPVLTGDSIFNGAMDNASGTATLIETARLAAKRGGNKRTLAFVAVTAEEKGLLGSRYFAAHPSLKSGTIVADLNTDMFLPLIPLHGIFAYGSDESDLADDVDAVLRARGLELLPDPEPQENRFVRSDQYSFIRRGIPSLAFKVGYKPGTPDAMVWTSWVREHYHKLSDDITQPVNFETAASYNAMYAELALRIANRATKPAWRANSFFATPVIVP